MLIRSPFQIPMTRWHNPSRFVTSNQAGGAPKRLHCQSATNRLPMLTDSSSTNPKDR